MPEAGMETENTEGLKEGYKCVRKTKGEDLNQTLCRAAKTERNKGRQIWRESGSESIEECSKSLSD